MNKLKTKAIIKMKVMKQAILISTLLLSVNIFAQKFGHINSNELLLAMPERAAVEGEVKKYTQQLESQLNVMSKEYQQKLDDYRDKEATMTDAIKQDKIKEITNLEERIASFQQTAEKDLQEKNQTLLKPIIDKAKKAIEDVAKENNYTYILDSGLGVLLYYKDSDDIMPLVKKKLGLL